MSMQVVRNIVVGKKDVDFRAPSHVKGVHEGNWPGKLRFSAGVRHADVMNVGGKTRSTGINPDARMPIDPAMPHLSPP